jgi:glycosyltransferase involved in cell wall biosynthesis
MHVLLIHQAFAGPGDPGGTRHYELASELALRGHRTTIIASDVSYLTGDVTRSRTSLPDGIRVVRVPSSRRLHESYAARAASFLGFSAGALRAALAIDGVDIVWGTSPPLPQLVPAWLASLRVPGGLVFEERDLWPEFAIGMGVVREGAATAAALLAKRFLYARAQRVIVNSPGFLPFLDGYGVDPSKVRVIPNGVDPRPFDPEDRGAELRREWGADDRFVVVYAGALGPANDLDVALDAAASLRATDALFVLVGDGKARPELMRKAAERGLANVRFVGALPKEDMPRVLAASDACFATLRDIPLFRTTYPNKVFDYMAAGRPVLLLIDGVIREVVEEAGAGIFVPPGDAAGLAAAVRRLASDPAAACEMGRRGRRAVLARFDRREHAALLEALFTEVLEARRGRARAAGPVDPESDRPRDAQVRATAARGSP